MSQRATTEPVGPDRQGDGRPGGRDGPEGRGQENEPGGTIAPPTPQVRAETLLDAEAPILAMIGAGRPLPEVLDALCRMIETLLGDAICSVMLLDADGKALRWAATPSLPATYREAVECVPVGPCSGSCGTAAHSGEVVIVEDIADDPLWERFREGPMAVGLRACWSIPILSSAGGVLGTFGTSLPQPRRPAGHELRVCRRAALLAAAAIERDRSEGLYRRIVEAANEGIWILDVNQRTTFVNARMAEMLGHSAGEMLGRSAWDFTFEEDRPEGLRRWGLRQSGELGQGEILLRRKDGTGVWAQTSTSPTFDAEGRFVGTLGMFADITGRKEAEEAARRQVQLTGAIAENATTAIFLMDAEGRTTYMNPAAEAMTGYPLREATGRVLHELVHHQHPDGSPFPMDECPIGRHVLAQRELRGHEDVFVRRDGSFFPVRCAARPIVEGGSLTGIVLEVQDITEQRRAEGHLALQARVLESMTEGVSVSDEGGTIVYTNPAEDRIFGYGPGELVGRHVSVQNDYPPEENARIVAGVIEHLKAGGHWSGEWRNRKKDGTSFWTFARITAIERDGRRYWVCVQEDITERKRAEAALRESEAQYRAIYDQAAVGIAEVGLDGRFLRANARYCEIVGYPQADLIGRHFREISHPDDPPGHREKFARITEGSSSYTIEKRYVRQDGRVVWAQTAVSLIRDASGRPERVVAVVEDITERVRLEDELRRRMAELGDADRQKGELLASLREGEERFRGLMEQAPFSIQVFSPEGRTLGVNRAWEELWGMTFDQVADYNVLEDPQLEAKGVLPHIRRAFAGEPTAVPAIRYDPEVTIPGRSRHQDPRRWVSAVAYPLKDAAGRVREVVLVHDDITERTVAEEALRASEERFRHLAEAVPHLVWITRPDRSVEYVNRRWLDYTGQTMEEALALEGWRAAVHPDDLGRVVEASTRSHATGEPLVVEYRIRDASGAYRWHLGRTVLVFDPTGRLERRFGTATDIDDRKRAEQAARFLADAGATLAGLVDEGGTLREVARLAVPFFADWCAVDLLDEAGALRRVAVAHVDPSKVEWAHELHRLYPPHPDEPHGVHQVIRSGRAEVVPEVTDEMLVAGARDEDHLAILRDLGVRSYLCVPLEGRGGTLGAISFVATDPGRRFDADDLRLAGDLAHRAAIAIDNARLYDRLREADRRKDEFLATLAHELRNPLAPIRTALHLMMQSGGVGVFEAERAMAERQVVHLARLIDDLMDVARISKGKLELHRESVDLNTVARQAVETARTQIDDRRHRLTVSLPESPVLLEADPTRLEQVFWNLLNNAAKYTEPGGRIDLSAESANGEVVVRVRDTGIGIVPEMLPRLFQMFVQVGEHREHAQGGLGIGLGLVRTLVELHGGSVTAHSAGPGTGSEFVVRLPAAPPKESPAGAGGARPPEASTPPPRRRILIVDDNADAANILGKMLSRGYGQDVRVAHDGPEGLEAADAFRPEIVLLDIGLPGMSGHEVARQLREQPWGAEITLIAVTGWGQEADRRRSHEAGFDHHLVKPMDPGDLIRLLRTIAPRPDPA